MNRAPSHREKADLFVVGLVCATLGCTVTRSTGSTGSTDASERNSGGNSATGGDSAGSGGSAGTGGLPGGGGSQASGGKLGTGGMQTIGSGGISAATGGTSIGGAGGLTREEGSGGMGTGGGSRNNDGGVSDAPSSGGGVGGRATGGGVATGGGSGQGGTAGTNGGATRSLGCGKSFTRPNAGDRINISAGGMTRVYQLFIPPNYAADTAWPFVVTFHGGNGSSASSRAEMNLESSPKGIVAYLNYVNSAWSYAAGSADIAYFEAVMAEVESKYCVDTHRVLVTGFSLGAIQTNGIGCTKGGKSVRAIVPIDGSGPYPQPAPPSEASLMCPDGTPVGDPAVMVIHGSADTTALYEYGQWSANFWRKWSGCAASPVNLTTPFQGCVGYQGCRAPVNFCTHPGNHMVPSAAGAWVWAFIDMLK